MRVPVAELVAFVVLNNFMDPASIPDLVPPNTSELFVASCKNTYLNAESSHPKNPSLADELK